MLVCWGVVQCLQQIRSPRLIGQNSKCLCSFFFFFFPLTPVSVLSSSILEPFPNVVSFQFFMTLFQAIFPIRGEKALLLLDFKELAYFYTVSSRIFLTLYYVSFQQFLINVNSTLFGNTNSSSSSCSLFINTVEREKT